MSLLPLFDLRRCGAPLSALRGLLRDRSGSTLMTFGLLAPVLFMGSAAAVDYSLFMRDHTRLQAQVDAAAVAAARELQMAKAKSEQIAAVATSFVHSAEPTATVSTKVDTEDYAVTVSAQKTYDPAMGVLFFRDVPIIKVSATAKLDGNMPLCLLALDRSAPATVDLEQSSLMTATGCMVYSNSKSASGLQAKDNAHVKAGLICSAGGAPKAGSADLSPRPVTDCPQLDDPLRGRTAPSDGACAQTDLVVSGGAMLLQPGVYCKGLKITNGAEVTLAKGIFIVKDGPLIVDNGGSISGDDVSIYLKGRKANLDFETDSTINLTASKDGPLAGLLIFDDPSGASAPTIPPFALPIPLLGDLLGVLLGAPPREHKILSDNARTLHGTIYMPKGRLIIDATKPIADKSAYTVLVVQRIDLHAGPNLILNSDYSASEVPVPKGVGPYSNKVLLTN
jgi:putative Flp pilus-assembly TadE/G-like protein